MKAIRQYLAGISPSAMLVQGYLFYLFLGWLALSLPWAQSVNVSTLDNLFMAASAVSTTGLVTVDPGSSYTFLGEVVLLLLIQLGGIGYMTFGSFVLLAMRHKASNECLEINKRAFALPHDFDIAPFIRKVVIFTLSVEAVGALLLYLLFFNEGVDNALWSAIFHSVSAFCTAGFSLFSNSFEGFASHVGVNVVISTLSLLGAIGFIVMVDVWTVIRGSNRYLHFTSKVILKVTLSFLGIGTLLFMWLEPSIAELPAHEKLIAAFFQVMTATTTVGFNTLPIGSLAPALIVVLYFLMMFGAAPSGTGGGLKSTNFAALAGLIKSTLKTRDKIRLNKRTLSPDKVQWATASFAYYFAVLFVATVMLLTLEDAGIDVVLFEVFSALGTVGLSMGLTGQLTEMGKFIVVVLMFMGRIGILTFGIMLAMHDETREEEKDDDLVL
ncbi:TrkH family potassium uptake protein [Alteromonas oceanisediminis]|uniref:TrkH family potassium uptake protein n=1 Tax=Alteromonas oceanisediminis TaxID=2836180 RepID=UPI001BD9DA58|nr:potassium transporter TrkG [Alteromonas oceanisediminis]MBT0587092.1 potassium transporter KtrB [Alteromonas oceanisediminis]